MFARPIALCDNVYKELPLWPPPELLSWEIAKKFQDTNGDNYILLTFFSSILVVGFCMTILVELFDKIITAVE